MDAIALILFGCGVLAPVLFRAIWSLLQRQSRRLPGSFDFGAYKSREITARGVFDKTKWHWDP